MNTGVPVREVGQVRCGDCSFRVDEDSPKDDVRQAMLARGATGCLKRAAYEYKSPTRWHSCDMFREDPARTVAAKPLVDEPIW